MPARGFDSFRVPSMMVGFDSQQQVGEPTWPSGKSGHCSSLSGVFDLCGGSRGTPRDWHCRFFLWLCTVSTSVFRAAHFHRGPTGYSKQVMLLRPRFPFWK